VTQIRLLIQAEAYEREQREKGEKEIKERDPSSNNNVKRSSDDEDGSESLMIIIMMLSSCLRLPSYASERDFVG
jgi:hypothetical protein